ncbi:MULTISPECIES: winged helix-turn-helix domain-containing protein [unclassified Cedecea]|uniref:winged helix-turn-helix domain-containing protein n=1 Tax=unclassified Cedecea TaxID=2649846 RepID=UPI003019BC83
MSEVILVNHQVKFDPGNHTLSSLSAPKKFVTLPASTARCLHLLLSQHGQVITIKQLHTLVWGKNKTIVSNNTIYQNISIIRKALIGVGGDKNIIETLTRRGWCVPETVDVSIAKNRKPIAGIEDIKEKTLESPLKRSDVPAEKTPTKPVNISNINSNIQSNNSVYLWVYLSVVLIIALCMLAFIYWP